MKKKSRRDKLLMFVCTVVVSLSTFFCSSFSSDAGFTTSWNSFGESGFSFSYTGGTLTYGGNCLFDWEYFSPIVNGSTSNITPQYIYRDNVVNFQADDLYSSCNIPFATLNGGSGFSSQTGKNYVQMQFSIVPSVIVDDLSGFTTANYSFNVTEASIICFGKEYPCTVYKRTNDYYAVCLCVIDSGINTMNFANTNFILKIIGSLSGYGVCDYNHAYSGSDVSVHYDISMSVGDYAFRYRGWDDDLVESSDIENQTNTIVNGFDDSSGSSMNSGFESGLNDYTAAEDSLFQTASSGMQDFSFFDISSVPAMVNGLSFVSSVMTSWFNQAGGASGVGIVLSILFSVMLVSMALGLYRFFQSKGGRD